MPFDPSVLEIGKIYRVKRFKVGRGTSTTPRIEEGKYLGYIDDDGVIVLQGSSNVKINTRMIGEVYRLESSKETKIYPPEA